MNEPEVVEAVIKLRDAAQVAEGREALDWALAVLRGGADADASWSLSDYQPVAGDPLATIRARLMREIHGEITADELGAWSQEGAHGARADALAQVLGVLTGRNPHEIRQEVGRAIHKLIGPPPSWAPGAG